MEKKNFLGRLRNYKTKIWIENNIMGGTSWIDGLGE
jgi:hypothetical protein